MQSLQEVMGQEAATKHERFLSSVSRHLMSLDLDPMLEAVAHAALPLFGDVCAIDRASGAAAVRLLEVRNGGDARVESPDVLAAVARAEVRVDGGRSRLTVPIAVNGERFGSLTFVGAAGAHGASELALAQELAERLALAIGNVRTHAQLREALADREKLISIAAHELRGPICSVRLCIQALKRAERSNASKGGRLLAVHDLEPVDLCDVVREVAARMTMDANRAGSELSVSVEGALVGRWDRSRLDQVVTNLVANAIKFGQNRPIALSAEADPDGTCARLVVTDHGLGIDPDIQQRIFEPFKRAVVGRRYEGLGLGLYIVRNIVGQLGGSVSVKSAPGLGATFTVELPLDTEGLARATGS